MQSMRIVGPAALSALLLAACTDPVRPVDGIRLPAEPVRVTIAATSQVAAQYAVDFVSTAASGVAMNDSGHVVGTSYQDTGCGPFCLPPQQTVVWKGASRLVLPVLTTGTPIGVHDIDNAGRVVGLSGYAGSTTTALLWQPTATGYAITNLGALTGNGLSEALALDGSGRVYGYSRGITFLSPTKPFVWSAATGVTDLVAAGYPAEIPLGVSRGGMVATQNYIYRFGTPGSVTPFPAPPRGYLLQNSSVAINDAGDAARTLVSTSSQNLMYPFRLRSGGAWEQIGTGSGMMTASGIGSLNAALDVTFTALSVGFVAPGPNGTAVSLTSRISPAYPNEGVVVAGEMNARGEILARTSLGNASRVTRLVPIAPCAANCLRATTTITGKFVQDPANPGYCLQSPKVYNAITATVAVKSETGAILPNASVTIRVVDGYWSNKTVTALTNAQGNAVLKTTTPPCVGTVAAIVTGVKLGTRTLDRTTGRLVASVIPR